MMIDLSGPIAVVALMWTIYQQYSISKICERCPFRLNTTKKENETTTEATQN